MARYDIEEFEYEEIDHDLHCSGFHDSDLGLRTDL